MAEISAEDKSFLLALIATLIFLLLFTTLVAYFHTVNKKFNNEHTPKPTTTSSPCPEHGCCYPQCVMVPNN